MSACEHQDRLEALLSLAALDRVDSCGIYREIEPRDPTRPFRWWWCHGTEEASGCAAAAEQAIATAWRTLRAALDRPEAPVPAPGEEA